MMERFLSKPWASDRRGGGEPTFSSSRHSYRRLASRLCSSASLGSGALIRRLPPPALRDSQSWRISLRLGFYTSTKERPLGMKPKRCATSSRVLRRAASSRVGTQCDVPMRRACGHSYASVMLVVASYCRCMDHDSQEAGTPRHRCLIPRCAVTNLPASLPTLPGLFPCFKPERTCQAR